MEPEQDLVPLPTEDEWDEELVERLLSEVTERANGILDLSAQVKEYKELMEESIRRQTLELQEKENETDLRQSLEAELLTLVLEMQTREVVSQVEEQEKVSKESLAKKHEEVKREVQVRTEKLEEREKVVRTLGENVQERCNEMEKREEEFQLKAEDVEVKREELEVKEKKVEERMSELEKREELFQLKAKDVEVKMRSLEEEREGLLQGKERELETERRKRSRNESETSLFSAENDRDDNPLIHTGKRHKPIREHSHKETYLDCGIHGSTSTDLASASSNGIEVYEVECIDDEADEDPEPYNCLDPDFNNFNNTMSSFSVGQVWALYDPFDHMPRFYAKIRKVLQPQQRVEVTWLESTVQTSESHKPIPIACGEFKYGDKTTRSNLMFSHEMDPIRTEKKKSITINPRKGETWALFRDWSHDNRKVQKRPFGYDFVLVLSELDSDHGIGVAYLGRVEGFTSVYELSVQHDYFKTMIPSDEMLRFSHRVPSYKLTGDEKKGVPAGSFELDPAAIPRDYIEAFNVVKEEEGVGRRLALSA